MSDGSTKFAKGDRVRIIEKLFPSYNEGLFAGLPKTGTVVEAQPGSILPYRVTIDTFEHHPFWFYDDQLGFEDAAKETEWNQEQKAKAAQKASGG